MSERLTDEQLVVALRSHAIAYGACSDEVAEQKLAELNAVSDALLSRLVEYEKDRAIVEAIEAHASGNDDCEITRMGSSKAYWIVSGNKFANATAHQGVCGPTFREAMVTAMKAEKP
jgi:hypothetical protein